MQCIQLGFEKSVMSDSLDDVSKVLDVILSKSIIQLSMSLKPLRI